MKKARVKLKNFLNLQITINYNTINYKMDAKSTFSSISKEKSLTNGEGNYIMTLLQKGQRAFL